MRESKGATSRCCPRMSIEATTDSCKEDKGKTQGMLWVCGCECFGPQEICGLNCSIKKSILIGPRVNMLFHFKIFVFLSEILASCIWCRKPMCVCVGTEIPNRHQIWSNYWLLVLLFYFFFFFLFQKSNELTIQS